MSSDPVREVALTISASTVQSSLANSTTTNQIIARAKAFEEYISGSTAAHIQEEDS